MYHGAILINGMLIVVGGLTSAKVEMGMLSAPPCNKDCFALNITGGEVKQWVTIPSQDQGLVCTPR